jgi:hypothetical protein
MAKWTDMGHAMRRRMGAPSSHLEAAGPSTSRKHETSEEQYETAKTQNSPRASIGEEPMANSDNLDNSMSPVQDVDDYAGKAAKGTKGTMVPKKSTQSMDPTAGGKANRTNVAYTERLGASYRVSVPYTPTVDPTAGPTMANARTIPSVQGRQNPNFMGAINDQY